MAKGVMVAFALAFASHGDARADTPEQVAMDRFKQGAEAYGLKDYRAAAIAFESANAAVRAGATMYNAALAWIAAGDSLRAGNDFARALELGGLSRDQAADASQRLEVIDKDVGHLDVEGPAGGHAAVDGVGEIPLPAHVRVLPGDHYVTMTRADGSTDTHRARVGRGASVRVDFAQAAAPPGPGPGPGPTPSEPSPTPTPTPPDATEPASARPPSTFPQRTLGWVGLGGGVVLSGVAIGVGVAGLDAKNAFVAGGDHDQGLHDRAVTFRTVANVAWVGAGVLGAGGIVLLLTAPKRSDDAGPAVSIGPRGVIVAGAF